LNGDEPGFTGPDCGGSEHQRRVRRRPV